MSQRRLWPASIVFKACPALVSMQETDGQVAHCLAQICGMSLKAIKNLDYVILPCADVQAARAFYLNVMGFPLVRDLDSWVMFRVGTTFLTLRPRGPWLAWHDGDMDAGSASVQLAFLVNYDEVDQCHRELVERGVEIVEAPRDQDFGHRTLFFRDPDNNVLEIYAELEPGQG